jgi:hypothetical protein
MSVSDDQISRRSFLNKTAKMGAGQRQKLII